MSSSQLDFSTLHFSPIGEKCKVAFQESAGLCAVELRAEELFHDVVPIKFPERQRESGHWYSNGRDEWRQNHVFHAGFK